MVTDYKVISNDDRDSFNRSLKEALADGWVLTAEPHKCIKCVGIGAGGSEHSIRGGYHVYYCTVMKVFE